MVGCHCESRPHSHIPINPLAILRSEVTSLARAKFPDLLLCTTIYGANNLRSVSFDNMVYELAAAVRDWAFIRGFRSDIFRNSDLGRGEISYGVDIFW